MWIINRIIVCIWLVLTGPALAATITPQVGGGIGQFDGGISGINSGPAVCGGYQGPGNIIPSAVMGFALRAWSASLCGQAFAQITVSGVSADMLTSATTGAIVPQTINGTLCPAASTTACVVTKWYDQLKSNACTGSCDMAQGAGDNLPVLTTTCPTPLAVCIYSLDAAPFTILQAAANITLTQPYSLMAFAQFTSSGTRGGTYFGADGSGIYHGAGANETDASCNGQSQVISGVIGDNAWNSLLLDCGPAAQSLYSNGSQAASAAYTPASTTAVPFLLYTASTGNAFYETEAGLWGYEVSAAAVALNNNQKLYYGLVAISAQNYFFNSTTGLDSNNCKFASGTAPNGPCLTITKANALPNFGGGSLTFVGTFTGCLVQSQGNVSTPGAGPITITATGATLTSNCGGANSGSAGPQTCGVILDSISATVNGGSYRGSGFTAGSATQFGICAQNSSGAGTPVVIIENVDIQGFAVVGGINATGAEIYASNYALAAGFPNNCGQLTVSILNSTFHGASTTAQDETGVNGAQCFPSPVMTATFQGNIVFNMGGQAGNNQGTGSGAILNGTGAGSIIKFSLAHDNGGNANACGGPAGLWFNESISSINQFNEVYNMQNIGGPLGSICDLAGYDWDTGSIGGIGEYLYSHNNAGPSFLLFATAGSNVYRYGIGENDGFYGDDGGGVVSINGGTGGNAWGAYNLTLYITGTSAGSTEVACAVFGISNFFSGGIWANNSCSNSWTNQFGQTTLLFGGNSTGMASVTVANNDYYTPTGAGGLSFATNYNGSGNNYATLALFQVATSQEANSIMTNPTFSTPPSGTCTWTPSSISSWPPSGCPSAYSTVAAALKGAGADVCATYPTYCSGSYPSTAGIRDYYANTVPRAGPLWNMGAYGGP
jgi:hypothetical protein